MKQVGETGLKNKGAPDVAIRCSWLCTLPQVLRQNYKLLQGLESRPDAAADAHRDGA